MKPLTEYIYTLGDLSQYLHQQIYSRFNILTEKEQSMHVMNKNWRNIIADACVLLGKDLDGDIITIQGHMFITNLKYGIIIRPSEERDISLPEKAYMIRCKVNDNKNHVIVFANSEEEAVDVAIKHNVVFYDDSPVIEYNDDKARLISRNKEEAYLFIV